jgi:hypothetical protein
VVPAIPANLAIVIGSFGNSLSSSVSVGSDPEELGIPSAHFPILVVL